MEQKVMLPPPSISSQISYLWFQGRVILQAGLEDLFCFTRDMVVDRTLGGNSLRLCLDWYMFLFLDWKKKSKVKLFLVRSQCITWTHKVYLAAGSNIPLCACFWIGNSFFSSALTEEMEFIYCWFICLFIPEAYILCMGLISYTLNFTCIMKQS